MGTSSNPHGIITGRDHHGLSSLEATYFFLMERRGCVVDIREQWPILVLERTLELCAELGIRHNFKRGLPEPFTIDFLITEQVEGQLKYRAASVKSEADARDPAVRMRLEVERRWCYERGIPWTLVDTSQFNKTLLETLRFIRGWSRELFDPTTELDARFVSIFNATYRRNEVLRELIERLVKALQLPFARVQHMFEYCAWSGRIGIDLGQAVALNRPLVLKREDHRA